MNSLLEAALAILRTHKMVSCPHKTLPEHTGRQAKRSFPVCLCPFRDFTLIRYKCEVWEERQVTWLKSRLATRSKPITTLRQSLQSYEVMRPYSAGPTIW
jgi:hypothetical protein